MKPWQTLLPVLLGAAWLLDLLANVLGLAEHRAPVTRAVGDGLTWLGLGGGLVVALATIAVLLGIVLYLASRLRSQGPPPDAAPRPGATTEQSRAHDQRLLNQLRTTLPRGLVTAFLRQQDMGGSWRVERMRPLSDLAMLNDVEHEFLDEELERRRAVLHEKVRAFRELLNTRTFREQHNPEWQGVGVVPRGPDHPDTVLWEERSTALNEAGTEAADAYDDLMRRAGELALGLPDD